MNHLDEVGLSRTEHFIHAWGLIWNLMKMIGALMIHSLAPRYFTKYYSKRIEEINERR